nr:ribonuclease H-like domain-containing protein [Tanacetum cinerariifolium]
RMHSPLQTHFNVGLRNLKMNLGSGNMCWGYVCISCGNLISWKNKKQSTLSISLAEAEYRCMAFITCKVVWLINLLKDLNVEDLLPVYLYCDSTSAIQIAANPVFHKKTKHFEIDVHLVREKVASGVIKIINVNSVE